MVHGDHNKNRSGGFFLIILGALIFITSPLYLADSPVRLEVLQLSLGLL